MKSETLVVISTYNEQNNISKVLKETCKYFKNVLVVDNNSEDNTLKKIKKFPILYVRHSFNLGKSNSMKTGLDYASLKKFKYVAYMDGDGQHKASDLYAACKKIYTSKNNLVIGYRKNLNNLNVKKMIGTKILEKVFYILYQKKILDIQSGLRVFNTKIKRKIYWQSSGIRHYFADAEITCNAVKNNCKIDQIPITTISSEKYKGMNIIQGLFLIFMIFIWRII